MLISASALFMKCDCVVIFHHLIVVPSNEINRNIDFTYLTNWFQLENIVLILFLLAHHLHNLLSYAIKAIPNKKFRQTDLSISYFKYKIF
jgi:hypothetical protein